VLAAAAPAGGSVVTLTSSDPTATVPGSITIAEGTSTGQFTVTTRAVSTETIVTVSGSAGGETRSKGIRLTPATSGLALLMPRSPYIGWGQTISITAQSNGPAPSGGVLVTLTADGSALTVPGSLTIPGGQTTGSVNVTARTNIETTVRVTGSAGGDTRSASIQLLPVFIRIDSAPDDYVGQGRSYRVEPGTFVFGADLQYYDLAQINANAADPVNRDASLRERITMIAVEPGYTTSSRWCESAEMLMSGCVSA